MNRTRPQTSASEKKQHAACLTRFIGWITLGELYKAPWIFPIVIIKLFGLLFAHLDDDTTHVMAALRANGVSWCDCAALRAHMKLTGLLGMVGSTLARS